MKTFNKFLNSELDAYNVSAYLKAARIALNNGNPFSAKKRRAVLRGYLQKQIYIGLAIAKDKSVAVKEIKKKLDKITKKTGVDTRELPLRFEELNPKTIYKTFMIKAVDFFLKLFKQKTLTECYIEHIEEEIDREKDSICREKFKKYMTKEREDYEFRLKTEPQFMSSKKEELEYAIRESNIKLRKKKYYNGVEKKMTLSTFENL